MKKFLSLLFVFLMFSFVFIGCDKNIYDVPKSGNGFLSVALIWEDKFNSTDEIESVNLWIYDKTGALALDKKYTSANELALEKFELQAGNCTVVIGVNVNEPIEEECSSTPEDLKYELARQSELYENVYYGDKTAEVVSGESRAVYVSLNDKPHYDHRYLSITIKNVPENIKLRYGVALKLSAVSFVGEYNTDSMLIFDYAIDEPQGFGISKKDEKWLEEPLKMWFELTDENGETVSFEQAFLPLSVNDLEYIIIINFNEIQFN